MTILRAALVTPLSGPLATFGRAAATGLTLWVRYATRLPPPWTGVELDVRDTAADPEAAMSAAIDNQPDVVFGPYGSSTMLAAMRVTGRVVWNHGGATSRLSWPAFPRVINVLSPASTYFDGVLHAVRTTDPNATTVSILYASRGFARDVASGAINTATKLNFEVQAVPFEPNHAVEIASTLPGADVLLVIGSFANELAVAPVLLTRTWRAVAFVGAGVDEVLAPLGDLREGLLGPAQWIGSSAMEPDEGPNSDWFVAKYRHVVGVDPPYPATQAFAAGLLCARCLRESGVSEDAAQLAAARQLACTTLYGRFRIDPVNGLQVGHEVLIVQWQDDTRRVVWPPEQAELPLLYPLMKRGI
ncbi:MAG TPA: ABC transporter substrate-binding protein [Ktedonobacteraceae bacterium]